MSSDFQDDLLQDTYEFRGQKRKKIDNCEDLSSQFFTNPAICKNEAQSAKSTTASVRREMKYQHKVTNEYAPQYDSSFFEESCPFPPA